MGYEKMTKNMVYIGLCFSGYAFFQLLGMVIKGIPESRTGAIALAITGLLLILILGFYNWCGLWYQSSGHLSKNQSLVGFAPTYVFGSMAIVALIVGFLIGG